MNKNLSANNSIVYQTKNGEISLRPDFKKETIWASQAHIADIFDINRSVVTKHINNLFKSGEVTQKRNVQKMHIANSDKPVTLYSLDIILGVGYRTNSSRAIEFRKWASKTLKAYIIEGYAINKKRVLQNYDSFLTAIESIKKLLPSSSKVDNESILELVKVFASTWFSLQAYDKSTFPKGTTQRTIKLTADDLETALQGLKQDLIEKGEASELFCQPRSNDVLAGIIGNIFQSFAGKEVYSSLEEKAAHLLYFIVKNHPFTDGNKRAGAFAFIWFLNKVNLLNPQRITPEALTALTLFIAESNPKEKDKIIGVILQLVSR